MNLESLDAGDLNKEFEQKLSSFNNKFLETLTDSLTQQLGLGTGSQSESQLALAPEENEEMDGEDQTIRALEEAAGTDELVECLPMDRLLTGRSLDEEEEAHLPLEEEVIKELETKDLAIEEEKTKEHNSMLQQLDGSILEKE